MKTTALLSEVEENALQLFNFKRLSSEMFSYDFKNYRRNLHNRPLIINFRKITGSYPDGCLTILDNVNRGNVIFRKWGSFKDLVKDLIDRREEYFDISYSYNIFKVISNFNIIGNVDVGKETNNLEIWAILREYETCKWGGVDKDNKFTVFVETKYFISFKGFIYIDPYLNKLLPNKIEIKNYYEDYKSSSDTKQDEYMLKRVSAEKKESFLNKYSFSEYLAQLPEIIAKIESE